MYFPGTAVDVSEADWRKCGSCRGEADRSAQDQSWNLKGTSVLIVSVAGGNPVEEEGGFQTLGAGFPTKRHRER